MNRGSTATTKNRALPFLKNQLHLLHFSATMEKTQEVAVRVAPTDLTVLVTGESGVGKEFFPQVIHAYSARKHNK